MCKTINRGFTFRQRIYKGSICKVPVEKSWMKTVRFFTVQPALSTNSGWWVGNIAESKGARAVVKPC